MNRQLDGGFGDAEVEGRTGKTGSFGPALLTGAHPEMAIPGFVLSAISLQLAAKRQNKHCIKLNAER